MPRLEGDFTKEFLDFTRQAMPGLVCLKHSDRFTKGIPDASITAPSENRTLWLEVKRLTYSRQHIAKPRTWVDNLPQLDTAVRLRGYYLVIDPVHGDYLFQRAQQVWVAHREKLLGLPVNKAFQELEFSTPARHAAWGKILLSVNAILKGETR